MRHVPSSDVDRRRCSQPCRGLKVIAVTEEVWPLNTEIGTPSGNLQIRIEQSFEAEATSVFPLLTAMSVISPWMAAKAKNNQQPLHQPGNTNNKL
jgi:hypothetical protein